MYYCNTVPSSTSYYSNILFAAGACSGTLSIGQVRNIQNHRNGLYAVANGVVINERTPLDLFTLLHEQFFQNNEGAHIWLSHPPDNTGISDLSYIFRDAVNRPTIHIEAINFGRSAFEVYQDIGCLSKLSGGMRVVLWDWTDFRRSHGGCGYYRNAASKERTYSMKIMDYVRNNVASSPLAGLCV